MPRFARKDLCSNFIHLIVQGINREFIFTNDDWKLDYKSIIKKNMQKFNIVILAYCIMDNHAHFLIFYDNPNDLSKFMLASNTSYAMHYNKINNRKGYVFRDRFFSQPILDYNHLFNCLVYIHSNPISASLVSNFSDYKFSSYNEFFNSYDLISRKGVQLLFGSSKDYLNQFIFLHQTLNDIDNIADVNDHSISPNQVISKFEHIYGKKIEDLKQDSYVLGLLLLELRSQCKLSLREMSKLFGINKDTLNNFIHKILNT